MSMLYYCIIHVVCCNADEGLMVVNVIVFSKLHSIAINCILLTEICHVI